MKAAYFSPLPPQQTGIATYSAHVLRALREWLEPVLFTTESDTPTHDGLPVRDIGRAPELVLDMHGCAGAIYHIGNNPFFHLEIYRTLLRHPGLVVLHDTVLYYLAAGQGPAALLKELYVNEGAAAPAALARVLAESPGGNPLRFPHPERHPLLRRVLEQAPVVLVHSDFARRRVAEAGVAVDVRTIPMLSYASGPPLDATALSVLRDRWGLPPGRLVLGVLGFVGVTKRIPVILDVLAALRDEVDCTLLIVGDSVEHLAPQIEASGLGARVVTTGYVSDAEFAQSLELIDVLVNLRYPSMGETSATLIQAMSHGTPCIVTNHGWFAELPDDTVCKVAYGADEAAELRAAVRALTADPERRHRLGEAARRYVERTCEPRAIARQYVAAFVDAVCEARRRPPAAATQGNPWAREYMLARAAAAYPAKRPLTAR